MLWLCGPFCWASFLGPYMDPSRLQEPACISWRRKRLLSYIRPLSDSSLTFTPKIFGWSLENVRDISRLVFLFALMH